MYIHENSVSQDLINSMNVKSLKFPLTPTFCRHSKFWKIASTNVFYSLSNGNNKMFFKGVPALHIDVSLRRQTRWNNGL